MDKVFFLQETNIVKAEVVSVRGPFYTLDDALECYKDYNPTTPHYVCITEALQP